MLLTFRCPDCSAVSHNPTDAVEGYCGQCHRWTAITITDRGTSALPAERYSFRCCRLFTAATPDEVRRQLHGHHCASAR